VLPPYLAGERWLTAPLTEEQMRGLVTALRIIRDEVFPEGIPPMADNL
jgi:hypothetical protein